MMSSHATRPGQGAQRPRAPIRRLLAALLATSLLSTAMTATSTSAANYDLACVERYSDAGFDSSADVSLTCDATDGFQFWLDLFTGHDRRFYWKNTLVWPRDYTEDDFGGGDHIEADRPRADLSVFSGHGSCQNPPNSTSPDFIITADPSVSVGANFVDINESVRLGEFPGSGVFGSNGHLDTFMMNASCPMDLVSLTNEWWDVFNGLHTAMGHSGTSTMDNLDSKSKLPTIGLYLAVGNSYRSAWMSAGLIDVQDGVCAVITGAGRTEAEAISRRDAEGLDVSSSDTLPATWLAWRWTCS